MRHVIKRGRGHVGHGVFVVRRYQQGHGFFGKIIKGAVFPLLKYLGKQGIKTAYAIGEDAARNPKRTLKDIAKRQLLKTAINSAEDGVALLKNQEQEGDGIKRKSIKAAPKRKFKKRYTFL